MTLTPEQISALVERLRERAERKWTDDANRSASLFGQAARALEQLQAEVERIKQPVGIAYTPGSWYKAYSIDEMQEFYMHRLGAIREAAKEHGYAIGLHGSCRRDFDLMAMQWRDDCSDPDTLAKAIQHAACGIHASGVTWEKKPNGRIATSLCICWTDHSEQFKGMLSVGHIDLSLIDTSAQLRQAKAEMKEKAAKICMNSSGTPGDCAAAIRNMEE
jgi:hypothetical protein